MKTFDEIFTEEERNVIDLCMKTGQHDSIPCALESAGFLDMTPEKEMALQAFLNVNRPASLEVESAVLLELQQKEIKEGYRIESPEQEREWQAKLDAERGIVPKEVIAEELPPLADNLSEIEMTKAEVIDELKRVGVKFDPMSKKIDLVTLLEAQKQAV